MNKTSIIIFLCPSLTLSLGCELIFASGTCHLLVKKKFYEWNNPRPYLLSAFFRGQMWGVNREKKMLIVIFHFTVTKCKAEILAFLHYFLILCLVLILNRQNNVLFPFDGKKESWRGKVASSKTASRWKDWAPIAALLDSQALRLPNLSNLHCCKTMKVESLKI